MAGFPCSATTATTDVGTKTTTMWALDTIIEHTLAHPPTQMLNTSDRKKITHPQHSKQTMAKIFFFFK